MTTIISPTSSPSVVYNKSGATVIAVSPGSSEGTGVISRYSGVTIVLVSATSDEDFYVQLPSEADIGDVVEIYPLDSSEHAVNVVPDSGSVILNFASNPPAVLTGFYFRRVSSTQWGAFGN